MRKLWDRLHILLQDNIRQQVTLLGFLFTLCVLVLGLAAFASGNNLLFLIVAVMLSTLLVSGFISRLGLAALELDLELPEHLVAHRTIQGRLVLKNRKWLTPSFSLHLTGSPQSGLAQQIYIPLVPAGSTLREPIELSFSKRGIYKDSIFEFSSRFPFGFTHRRAQVRLEREITVYPSIDPQPAFVDLLDAVVGEVAALQRGRGVDFYRVRPYELTESSRHIDWRATAHTGELQVREYAREQNQPVAILLDLRATSDEEEWFERAVECCAFLAWRLHERGTRVHLITQRAEKLVPENNTIYDLLRYLARVEREQANRFPPSTGELAIALSPRPEALFESGWRPMRVVSPAELLQR